MIDAGQLDHAAEGYSPGASSPPWPRPRPGSTALPVEEVHFHEVGAADSIADIVGAAVGWDLLGRRSHRGLAGADGHRARIKIAHGECSIPAPATAELLRGIPLAESAIEGELTTPTGAAILATLVDSFGPLPAMKIERIGYGAGQKDFAERPNILRLLVGEAVERRSAGRTRPIKSACWKPISTTPAASWSATAFRGCGTPGRWTFTRRPIQMKKNRPAVKLTVLCHPGDAAAMEDILFCRDDHAGRAALDGLAARFASRSRTRSTTPWGPVEGKIGWLRDGIAPFCPRVRVVPPRRRGPADAVAGSVRSGAEGVRRCETVSQRVGQTWGTLTLKGPSMSSESGPSWPTPDATNRTWKLVASQEKRASRIAGPVPRCLLTAWAAAWDVETAIRTCLSSHEISAR